MAELRVYRFFVILAHLAIVLVLAQNPIEEKTTFEAAFQGKSNQSYLSKSMPTADIFKDVFDQFRGNVFIPVAYRFMFHFFVLSRIYIYHSKVIVYLFTFDMMMI